MNLFKIILLFFTLLCNTTYTRTFRINWQSCMKQPYKHFREEKRDTKIYTKSLISWYFAFNLLDFHFWFLFLIFFFLSLFSRLSESLSKLFFRHCTGSFSEFLDFWIFWMFLRHLSKKVQVKNHCCVYTQQTT